MKPIDRIEMVDVEDIYIGDGRRVLDEGNVNTIRKSIEEVGALMVPLSLRLDDGPILIDGEEVYSVPVLVAGAHRLEAVKRLGWDRVPCIYITGDEDDAIIWEADENLARKDLTAAETAIFTSRRKEAWERKRARANLGGATCTTKPQHRKGFATETAAATGREKTTINRAVSRGEKIAPDVLKAVQGTDLDKGTTLDKLARMPIAEQRRAISTGIEKHAGVDASEARLKAAQNAYNRLNDDERRIFLEWLEENEPAIFDTTPAGRAA